MSITLTIPSIIINILTGAGIGLYVYGATLAWIVGLFPQGSGPFGMFETSYELNRHVKVPVMILTAPGAAVGFVFLATLFMLWVIIDSVRNAVQVN
jgi:hypothetical protein